MRVIFWWLAVALGAGLVLSFLTGPGFLWWAIILSFFYWFVVGVSSLFLRSGGQDKGEWVDMGGDDFDGDDFF